MLPEIDHRHYAKITRIKDADTFEVYVDADFRMYADMPLRLAHCDAPEKGTDAGKAAIKYVTDLIGPLPALCVVETYKPIDKYGRYLAKIYLSDLVGGYFELGAHLVTEGFAKPYEGGTKG